SGPRPPRPRFVVSRPPLPSPVSIVVLFSFFFFSRRRRPTSSKRDWSSDLCSSDLDAPNSFLLESGQGGERWGRYSIIGLPCRERIRVHGTTLKHERDGVALQTVTTDDPRSEERRVGKECRSRVSPSHHKDKTKK